MQSSTLLQVVPVTVSDAHHYVASPSGTVRDLRLVADAS